MVKKIILVGLVLIVSLKNMEAKEAKTVTRQDCSQDCKDIFDALTIYSDTSTALQNKLNNIFDNLSIIITYCNDIRSKGRIGNDNTNYYASSLSNLCEDGRGLTLTSKNSLEKLGGFLSYDGITPFGGIVGNTTHSIESFIYTETFVKLDFMQIQKTINSTYNTLIQDIKPIQKVESSIKSIYTTLNKDKNVIPGASENVKNACKTLNNLSPRNELNAFTNAINSLKNLFNKFITKYSKEYSDQQQRQL